MRLVPLDTLFLLHLLAELLELILDCPALDWVNRIQKFYIRCLSFLLSHVSFFAFAPGTQGSAIKDCTPSRSEEEIRVSRGDVEIVMERIEIFSCCEDGWLKEAMGAKDFSSMFEEDEPSFEEVKQAFCVFDWNGDGFIGAQELQRVLSNLGFMEGPTLDECSQMISVRDENNDGKIDFHEFVKLMESSL